MKQSLFLLCIILFTSCLSDDNSDFTKQTDADIVKYIEDNNLNATKTSSGLYYVITKEGIGPKPTQNSNVTVAYKGYFLDGEIFDQNPNGYTTGLNQVIPGWTEGITYFNEGAEGILLIPYNLGYGAYGSGTIPGGAVLIFDIKLISIN